MAEERALSDIKGGTLRGDKEVTTGVVPDVDEVNIRAGEKVADANLTDEERARLKEVGAITDNPKDLTRARRYKASSVQAAAHEEQIRSRGNEMPEPQDDTNPESAQSADETNKAANERARRVKEAEREFDEKLETDSDFRAGLLEGFADQPRQHEAIIHASKQDFIAERLEDDTPRAVPGRKASAARTSKATESQTQKGGK